MANETDQERALAGEAASPSEPDAVTEERPAPAPFVHARPARRSVEPIDDLAQDDEASAPITHDSGYTVRGGALSGRAYKRSRAQGQQLRRDLHYGQYLEIPKGRRDIFASRERKTRIKTAVALLVLLAVLAVVVFVVWEYMQANWGATG